MIERITGGKALPAEVVQQIVAKTDGVPLFVEELTKAVLESGLLREHKDRYELLRPFPPLAIPATLHDSLMARLDRLAIGKEVAQLAAARTHLEQGLTFTHPTAEQSQALRHDVAPGVRCLAYAANTLWCLGSPAQAVKQSQEARALLEALSEEHS